MSVAVDRYLFYSTESKYHTLDCQFDHAQRKTRKSGKSSLSCAQIQKFKDWENRKKVTCLMILQRPLANIDKITPFNLSRCLRVKFKINLSFRIHKSFRMNLEVEH